MTQVEIFEAFMISTWATEEDSPDYDTFHDAIVVADTMGAKPVGAPDRGWREYLFPDGSTTGIHTNANGIGIGTSDALP